MTFWDVRMSCQDRRSLGFIAEEISTVCPSLSPRVVNNLHTQICSYLQKGGIGLTWKGWSRVHAALRKLKRP